jgi:hypothetical protein
MVFSSKHSRNNRRGQPLFNSGQAPWTLSVVRRRSAGAFFVCTPAVGAGGGTRALRHAAARLSERADKVILLPLATVLLLGAGLAGWTAAYAASQLSA